LLPFHFNVVDGNNFIHSLHNSKRVIFTVTAVIENGTKTYFKTSIANSADFSMEDIGDTLRSEAYLITQVADIMTAWNQRKSSRVNMTG
jgi:predicted acetyltransferase